MLVERFGGEESVVRSADKLVSVATRRMELTGRDASFSIPTEASDFESWRNLSSTDYFELERPASAAPVKSSSHGHHKKLLNGSGLNLSTIAHLESLSGKSNYLPGSLKMLLWKHTVMKQEHV